MKKARRWPILTLVVVLAVGYLWLRSRDSGIQREDPSLVFNRIWVDSVQQKETDFVHAFAVITKIPVGLFQKASQYRFEVERFDYRHKKGPARLELHFPQSGKEVSVRYRIRPCDDLPPYDLCLVLSDNPLGGPRKYYGMREPNRAKSAHTKLRRSIQSHLAR